MKFTLSNIAKVAVIAAVVNVAVGHLSGLKKA